MSARLHPRSSQQSLSKREAPLGHIEQPIVGMSTRTEIHLTDKCNIHDDGELSRPQWPSSNEMRHERHRGAIVERGVAKVERVSQLGLRGSLGHQAESRGQVAPDRQPGDELLAGGSRDRRQGSQFGLA